MEAHPPKFVVSNSAGVHEGLSYHRENGVHVVRYLNVKDELRVLNDVDPETQREAGDKQEEGVLEPAERHTILIFKRSYSNNIHQKSYVQTTYILRYSVKM